MGKEKKFSLDYSGFRHAHWKGTKMAKSTIKYNGSKTLLDLFFDDYSLQSKSGKKLVFKGVGEDGTLTRMVVEGKGFVVKNGVLKKGTIEEVEFQNKKQKVLVELEDLQIGGKKFQAALSKQGVEPLLELLYAGNDKISSSAFSTSIFTGAGNDTVKYTGRGWVEFIDGPGKDKYVGSTFSVDIDNIVSYAHTGGYRKSGPTSGIDANMATGKVVDPWGFTDTLKNINVIIGTMKDDTVVSAAGSDRMRFVGLKGDDTFIGNSPEDSIDYRHDFKHGGKAGVTVNLAEGWAIDGFGDTDTVSGIDRVIGTEKKDTIIGGDNSEVIEGWRGNDLLTGGGGNDVFRFRDGFGKDIITDFEVGADRIRLNDLSDLFDGFEGLQIVQEGDDTVIRVIGDTKNSITLRDVEASTLTESDFIL